MNGWNTAISSETEGSGVGGQSEYTSIMKMSGGAPQKEGRKKSQPTEFQLDLGGYRFNVYFDRKEMSEKRKKKIWERKC